MTGELCRILWTAKVVHIDIDENHQKYLGFSWENVGKIRYLMLTVLTFGLYSAPFIFTKVMRCLVKILEKGRDKNLHIY